jgi:hypothetical protein
MLFAMSLGFLAILGQLIDADWFFNGLGLMPGIRRWDWCYSSSPDRFSLSADPAVEPAVTPRRV